jgi:ATP-dependent DNA helicase RecG
MNQSRRKEDFLVEIDRILTTLRAAGGDTAMIEVKSAKGGLPESLPSTICALANLPGGGFIILGLSEEAGMRPVGLTNVQVLKQGLGSQARMFTPPVHLDISDDQVEGQPVVIVKVGECDPSEKPCLVTSTGKAYLRSYDGDYELSMLERQGFLTARTQPRFDRQSVPGTTIKDLDSGLVTLWRDSIASRGSQGLGQFVDDLPELLRRGGVIGVQGEVTIAGLLALGLYPQQYLPRAVINAAVITGRPGERARNARTIDGPIPVMLETTMEWLSMNMGSTTKELSDGHVREVPDFPLIALRELVANALIHRDLAPWAEGQAIELRLRGSDLLIINPGGLYGITSDRLGLDHITSARNPILVAICQNARATRSSDRIVEALASGLPIVARELAAADLPPARYFDAGIRFTVKLSRGATAPSSTVHQASSFLRQDSNLASVLNAIRQQPDQTATEIATATGLTLFQTRRAVSELRTRGLIETDQGQGKTSWYRASSQPTSESL